MSDTKTLIQAMRILAHDIQSDDGVANAAIAEAADRLEELARDLEVTGKQLRQQELLIEENIRLKERIKRLEEVAAKLANCARFLGTWSHDETNVLKMKDEAMDELQKLEETKP